MSIAFAEDCSSHGAPVVQVSGGGSAYKGGEAVVFKIPMSYSMCNSTNKCSLSYSLTLDIGTGSGVTIPTEVSAFDNHVHHQCAGCESPGPGLSGNMTNIYVDESRQSDTMLCIAVDNIPKNGGVRLQYHLN